MNLVNQIENGLLSYEQKVWDCPLRGADFEGTAGCACTGFDKSTCPECIANALSAIKTKVEREYLRKPFLDTGEVIDFGTESFLLDKPVEEIRYEKCEGDDAMYVTIVGEDEQWSVEEDNPFPTKIEYRYPTGEVIEIGDIVACASDINDDDVCFYKVIGFDHHDTYSICLYNEQYRYNIKARPKVLCLQERNGEPIAKESDTKKNNEEVPKPSQSESDNTNDNQVIELLVDIRDSLRDMSSRIDRMSDRVERSN